MTEEIIIDGVNVAGCDGLNKILLPLKQCDLLQFKTRDGGVAGRWCTDHSNCYYKQLKKMEQENKELKEKIDIIEQIIKILYPNASDDELYDVAFNGEYIDKLKELKDTADTMLMANDIKKHDIDSLREANDRLEQENEELKDAYNEISNNSEILHENNCLRIVNTKLNEDLSQTEISMQAWKEQSISCRSALEEIREMILHCEDEYNCDRCKYHDSCLIDDDKFPDFSKALVNKINEVLNV